METKTVKHTEGPWTLKPSEYGCAHEISFATTSYGMIARVFTPGFQHLPEAPNEQECLANARLVAAAPDLLEACTNALGLANTHSHPLAKSLRAAIAKAERGE